MLNTKIKDKDNVIKTLKADFNVYVKRFPILELSPKEVFTQTWYDEDGDDEYVPSEPKFKAVEFQIDLVYVGNKDTFNTKYTELITFLAGEFSIYDEYTKQGRQKVRLVETPSEAKLYRRDKDIVEFSLKLKTNDPKTNITF